MRLLKFLKKDKLQFVDFKFEKIGNYDVTVVSISARLEFRNLGILYKLPLLLMKAYWGKIYNGQHPGSVSALVRLNTLDENIIEEQRGLDETNLQTVVLGDKNI